MPQQMTKYSLVILRRHRVAGGILSIRPT